jgi:hypothetical protein
MLIPEDFLHILDGFAEGGAGVVLHPPLYKLLCKCVLLIAIHYKIAEHSNAFLSKILCEDVRQPIVFEYGLADGGEVGSPPP